MATANTLAAYQAGAGSLSATVNGLGERAGNAPLEEIIMALVSTMNVPLSLDTTRLAALSQRDQHCLVRIDEVVRRHSRTRRPDSILPLP